MLHPNSELVAMAWLALVPGITPAMVATTLPQDTTAWQSTGFIQVTGAGGDPGVDVPMSHPNVQLDFWAVSGSAKPPMGKAMHLAQVVLTDGIRARAGFQRALSMPVSGYRQAHLREILATGLPKRMPGDDGSYARVTMDVNFFWTERPE